MFLLLYTILCYLFQIPSYRTFKLTVLILLMIDSFIVGVSVSQFVKLILY